MTNKPQKNIVSIILVLALVAGCFAVVAPASAAITEITDTSCTFYDEADNVYIFLTTELKGGNMELTITLNVAGEDTISETFTNVGTGNSDRYVTIGCYTIDVYCLGHGNSFISGNNPITFAGASSGHNWEIMDSKNATCTEDGYITKECKNHGEITTETLTALGHDFSILLDHKDATCEEDGYDVFKCSRCDETNTVTIPKLEKPTVVSAEVTSCNEDLQDKNNDNLRFTVRVTLSDDTTIDVSHAETVNGGQAGHKTFDYDGYSVCVEWNDNNTVTVCKVV